MGHSAPTLLRAVARSLALPRLAFRGFLKRGNLSFGIATLGLLAVHAVRCMATTVAPTSLTWAKVAVGVKGAPKAIVLTNGSSAITIGSIAISGANAGDFAIYAKTCGSSLAASATCTVNVLFAPTAAGTRAATLKFTDTGSGSPQSVALSGLGTGGSTSGGSGTVSAAPSSLSFSSPAVGTASAAQSVTLSNGTKSSISIGGVALSGSNAGDFVLSGKSCGASIAAAASCTVSVEFKPTATGARTATLKFTDSGSGSPQSVALSGTVSAGAAAFSISPTNPTVVEGNSLQFSATADVAWSATCGTIGATSGLFTAPSAAESCTIAATEIGANSHTVSTKVTVASGPSSGTLALYPTSAAVYKGSQQIFQAQLSGVPDAHSLSYSVDGVSGGNGTVGTIANTGVYTAPGSAGTHRIGVRDNSLGTTASATATVFSSVTADFASRASGLHTVPPNFFGAERMDSMHNTADLDLIKAGGIDYARFYALIPQVFKTSTPNWSPIDGNVSRIGAGGVHIILQMFQTPPWLMPSGNPCGSGAPANDAFPTDVVKWGQMAAEYIKHLDAKFPGVVTDYEIWNEPNTQALCVPTASKMSDYLKLYDAAAPLMRAQIKADGSNARVGGPATAGMQSSWVKAMLSDPVASQNIDFMSYHDYMFGQPQLAAQWNTYNGVTSVYQRTQNTGSGPMPTYLYASSLVAAGKQPQGRGLPIYNTEYNLNWAYLKDCCENSPVYSPVWNGMYVADVLNSIYSGAANVPGHMVYFAANAHPYFCLVGEIDSNMDCAYPTGSSPQPYPQYYVYQLIGATKYLGLQSGGTMAKSIAPGAPGNGLVVTAFFTATQDAIVLVNPTGETLSDIAVNAANTGLTSPEAMLYQIVNGESIQSSSLSLTSAGGTSYSTAVTMGPYSVMAISLK